jgi:hypothetical protein
MVAQPGWQVWHEWQDWWHNLASMLIFTGPYTTVKILLLVDKYSTVEVPNSQRIRCLDSSLGRVSACRGAEVRAPTVFVSALS